MATWRYKISQHKKEILYLQVANCNMFCLLYSINVNGIPNEQRHHCKRQDLLHMVMVMVFIYCIFYMYIFKCGLHLTTQPITIATVIFSLFCVFSHVKISCLLVEVGDIGGFWIPQHRKKLTNTALSQKKITKYCKTSKTLSKINEIKKLLPCIILKLWANINLIVFSNIKEC